MGAMQRNKGKRGEREVIALLMPVVAEVYEAHGLEPPPLKRNTLQCDGGGSDIAGLAWLALEVKYHADLSLGAWWQQTVEQCGPGQVPVLFYRRNNVKWKVMVQATLEGGVTVPAIVSVEDYLRSFRIRLTRELTP